MNNRIAALSFVLSSLALSVPALAGIIYDNGPTNGANGAWWIDGPDPSPHNQWVTNEFTAIGSGTVGEMDVGLWVPTGSTPTTFTWGINSPYGNVGFGIANLTAADYVYFLTNEYGYDVYNVKLTGLTSGMMEGGMTYTLTIGNANNSLSNQVVAWDVNSGPATCYFNKTSVPRQLCQDGSQAFTLRSVPEPGSMILVASGIIGLASIRRRKIRP